MAEDGSVVIPTSEFIHDVAQFMSGKATDVVIQELNDKLSQLKLIESQLAQKKGRLYQKLPEIKKALQVINLLVEKENSEEDIISDFELADNVYAKAKLSQVHSVNLWLGAQVMVEYPLEEAKTLLEQNLNSCKLNIQTNADSLEFIKDNITTTEVSISRVYNYDVERRRKLKEAGVEA